MVEPVFQSLLKQRAIPAALLTACSFACASARASDMIFAREALRDGLWEVARTHAGKSDAEDSKLLVLESYAREGRWDELSATLSGWRDMDGTAQLTEENAQKNREPNDAFLYYSALALAEKGETEEAAKMLAGAEFKTQEYHQLASGLRAKLAADSGDKDLAVKLIRESGFEKSDSNAKMVAAGVLDATGDKKGAERIWKEVAVDTNATEKALATAAANLGDAELLRKAAENAKNAAIRDFALIRLGGLLIKTPETFEEGAGIIRKVARDEPDADGAREYAMTLADAYLSRESWDEAAETFGNILEIWPDTAHLHALQEGRGWAYKKLRRFDEALEAFSRAEESAQDDATKAMSILEQGDVLADLGRAEESMQKYRIVLDRYPSTAAAQKLKKVVERRELEAKGRALYKDYRFAEAQKAFSELGKIDPEYSERAKFFVVLCLYGQGMDSEAEESAKKLAQDAQDESIRAEATLWLAKLAYNARRWSESSALFEEFVKMAPGDKRSPGALLWAARAAFSENYFADAIKIATRLGERFPESAEKSRAYVVQGEALIEMGRFDEAVLVLERALLDSGVSNPEERLHAEVLKADALFAMGADNPARYREALDAYRAVRLGESLSPGLRLAVSFKLGRTLEKLKRIDEAIDQYYTGVVLAYREARQKGTQFDDEARAAFARAAFRLADEFESRGKNFQAMHILELVIASDVPAAEEAEKRLDRIQTKGKFL